MPPWKETIVRSLRPPLRRARRQPENRNQPGKEHFPLRRHVLTLLLVGILVTIMVMTTQLVVSLFQVLKNGLKRRRT